MNVVVLHQGAHISEPHVVIPAKAAIQDSSRSASALDASLTEAVTGSVDQAQGLGVGTSHGAGASMDLKSAGETISRYSMSGE